MTKNEDRVSRAFAGVVVVGAVVLAAAIVFAIGGGIEPDQVTLHRVTGEQGAR